MEVSPQSPEEDASCCSFWVFSWTQPLFSLGNSHTTREDGVKQAYKLTASDVFPLIPEDRAGRRESRS